MEREGGPTADEREERQAEFHGDQRDIFEALLGRDGRLAEMYVGALTALDDRSNPDRLAQSAHSLRELIEKIPEVVGVGVAPVSELSAEAEKLEATLTAARESASFCDGNWDGEIDGPLRELVRAVEDLVAWRLTQRKTRREAVRETLRELDPSGRAVPGPLGEVSVKEWMQAHRYFSGVAHHKATGETAFRDAVAGFERLLVMLLRPRPFADFDEIDRIVTEAERGA